MKFIIIAFLLCGCGEFFDSDSDIVSKMKSPVTVIAMDTLNNFNHSPSATVRDANGRVYSMCGSAMTFSIIKSLKVGDRIK